MIKKHFIEALKRSVSEQWTRLHHQSTTLKNDTQYIGHTDNEKLEVKVKVLVTYELNRVIRLNQLQIELD